MTKRKIKERHPLQDLPFVKGREGWKPEDGGIPRNFWAVTPSGNWGEENKLGEQYAEAAATYILEHDDDGPPECKGASRHLLSDVAYAMIANQDESGVVLGFFWTIAEYVLYAKSMQAKIAKLEPGQGITFRKPYQMPESAASAEAEAREKEAAS
jgi:hypothetical protein